MINTIEQLKDYLDSAIRQGIEASKDKSKLKDFDFQKFISIVKYLDENDERNFQDEADWTKALNNFVKKDEQGNDIIYFRMGHPNEDINLASDLSSGEENYSSLEKVKFIKKASLFGRKWYGVFKKQFSSMGDKVTDFFGLGGADPILGEEEYNDMNKIMENWDHFCDKTILNEAAERYPIIKSYLDRNPQ